MDLKPLGRLVPLALVAACSACIPTLVTSVPASVPTAAPTAVMPTEPADTPVVLPSPTPTPELPMAARVNGQPVYLADYERELGQYESSLLSRGVDPNSQEGQENLAQARDWVLNVMIEQA